MATIISGTAVAAKLRESMKADVESLKQQGVQPRLAVILVGEDPASKVYVRNKNKACTDVGIAFDEYLLPATTTEQELLDLVQTLNESKTVHGILIQAPCPTDCLSRRSWKPFLPTKMWMRSILIMSEKS